MKQATQLAIIGSGGLFLIQLFYFIVSMLEIKIDIHIFSRLFQLINLFGFTTIFNFFIQYKFKEYINNETDEIGKNN